jgi:hypothetical protein
MREACLSPFGWLYHMSSGRASNTQGLELRLHGAIYNGGKSNGLAILGGPGKLLAGGEGFRDPARNDVKPHADHHARESDGKSSSVAGEPDVDAGANEGAGNAPGDNQSREPPIDQAR